jgi:hypothetical protein
MKVEVYYYELTEALREAINKRMNADLDFETFEGDLHIEVKTATYPNGYDKPADIKYTCFGEGDSFQLYLD